VGRPEEGGGKKGVRGCLGKLTEWGGGQKKSEQRQWEPKLMKEKIERERELPALKSQQQLTSKNVTRGSII